MLLLFRVILTIGWSRFRSRIGLFDASTVHFTVLPNDCDLNIHLNAGRFISFMDIARIELLGRMHVLSKLLKRGWRPIMGGTTVRFRRSLLPFARFAVRSRLLGWDEKWFYVEHIVENKEGALCATGVMRTLIRGREGNIATRDVLALMGAHDAPSPALPEFVEQWRRIEDARR